MHFGGFFPQPERWNYAKSVCYNDTSNNKNYEESGTQIQRENLGKQNKIQLALKTLPFWVINFYGNKNSLFTDLAFMIQKSRYIFFVH